MPSIQINVRLKPYQVYEIKKISENFDTTPSIVIRNAIDDYIDIFKTWRHRLESKELNPTDNVNVTYTPKTSKNPAGKTGLCFHPGDEIVNP